MLQQAPLDLKGLKGFTFSQPLVFTSGGAPLNLTSYSGFEVVIGNKLPASAGLILTTTMVNGCGLVVVAGSGSITVVIADAVTAKLNTINYHLRWLDPSGESQSPIGGTLRFPEAS